MEFVQVPIDDADIDRKEQEDLDYTVYAIEDRHQDTRASVSCCTYILHHNIMRFIILISFSNAKIFHLHF